MLNNSPSWLLDNPNDDPLLAQLEEERRRRAQQLADEAARPVPTVQETFAPIQPIAMPEAPTVDDYDLERQRRDAEAQVGMARAQIADLQENQPQQTAPLDTGASFKGPTGTVTEAVHSWDPLVQAASQVHGVPVNVIKAIIDIESKGQPDATSHVGAAGLMQVMPFHAKNGENLYDPATNIEFGTRILAENFARYGTWEQAAAAYFGAIDANGNVTGASDGNADGYTYVDLFTSKANAYLGDQRDSAPVNGPSLPGGDAMSLGNLRPSQLPEANPDLSIDEAYAACGPAAAIVFAAMAGRAPTLKEAVEMGRSIKAWSEGVGMYGPEAEVRLIGALGGKARYEPGFDPNLVINEVVNGNPVMVSSPATSSSEGHYAVISGYDQASGRFYFGSSATDLRGGQAWMTLEEYQSLRASGPITGTILVDNPLAKGPSAANASTGPSIPGNWDPNAKPKAGETDAMKAAREQWEAAMDLAEKVADLVEAARGKKKQDETAVQSPSEVAQLAAPTLSSPEFPAGSMDLLKQTTSEEKAQYERENPVQGAEQPTAETTDFVSRAREIEARYPDVEARKDDPQYQLEVTRLAREWQEWSNPTSTVTVDAGGNSLGVVRQADGTTRQATDAEMFADPTIAIANQELKNREAYLQREIETRREQAQVGQIWTLTPDEYTAWRKRQGMEIRPDEYQRHAAAVLDAERQGQVIPEKVKEAYGSEVKDRWQKDRRTALAPIEAVAAGAPYDGAEADFRWHSIDTLPTYAAAVAGRARDAFALSTLGIVKGWAQAADAGAEKVERMTGLKSSDSFGYLADRIERYIGAHPEMQSPDRPPEDFWESLQYASGISSGGIRADRFARSAAMLAPYLLGGAAIRTLIGGAFAATGMTGTTLARGTALASNVAITGLPAFGQFYDEAVNADPKQGQKPLSKDEALVWAGLHATIQTGIEAGLGGILGRGFDAAAARSPMIKKASELLSRYSVAQMAKEGVSESFLEEGPQQVLENIMAKVTYDPGRSVWDGVGAAIGSTFGPSAAFSGVSGGARAEAREASFRYATSLDADRRQELVDSVKDVASAERFANEQFDRTTAYGKSVGWDQRQIDLAQFRAARAIYAYGLDREITSRNLTNEQASVDPQVKHGQFAYHLAGEFEKRLSNASLYRDEQANTERERNLQDALVNAGLAERVSDRPQLAASSTQVADAPVRSFEDVEAAFERGERPSQEEIDAHYETWQHGAQRGYERYDPSQGQHGKMMAYGRGYYLSDSDEVSDVYTSGGDDSLALRDDEINDQHRVGGNVRRVLVPRDMRFLDAGSPISADDIAAIRSVLAERLTAWGTATQRMLGRTAEEALAEFDRVSQRQDGGSTYKALSIALEPDGPMSDPDSSGNDMANIMLARAGYDGVRFNERDVPIKRSGGSSIPYNGLVIFPQSTSKIRNGFSGTLGGSRATQTVPAVTAQTGKFEAPGLDQGEFESSKNADGSSRTLAGIDLGRGVPVAGADGITAVGLAAAPASILTKVANRAYATTFIKAAQQALPKAMTILQRVADVTVKEASNRSPRIEARIANLAVAAPEVYGWSDVVDDNGIAVNPAEIFHFAVVSVAKLEERSGRTFTDEERRGFIVRAMAVKHVETVLHEAAHHWGNPDQSQKHGATFDRVFKSSEMALAILATGRRLNATDVRKIHISTGLGTEQVAALESEIVGLITETEAAFAATFGTVGEQGDQLRLLNDDAREQRMLTLPGAFDAESDIQRLPAGGDLNPDDGDVGGGPPVPAAEGERLPGPARGGADGAGVRSGQLDAPVDADAQGADGLGSPGRTDDGSGAVVLPDGDAGGTAADGDAAASLTSPLAPRGQVNRVRDVLVQAVQQAHDKLAPLKLSPAAFAERYTAILQRRAESLADQIKAQDTGIDWDTLDAGTLMFQLGLDPKSAEYQAATYLFPHLFPNGTADPKMPPIDYFVDRAIQSIEGSLQDEADDRADFVAKYGPETDNNRYVNPEPRVWGTNNPEVDKWAGTEGYQSLRAAVINELRARGYIDENGREVPAEARERAARVRAEEIKKEEQQAQKQESQGGAKPKPSAEGERETSRQRQLTALERGQRDGYEEARANIGSDEFLGTLGLRGSARQYGIGLRDGLAVNWDKDATEKNYTAVATYLTERVRDMTASISNARSRGDVELEKSLRRNRSVLKEIALGLGATRFGYIHDASVTEERFPGDRAPQPIIRYRLPRGGGKASVLVKGLGRMSVDDSLSDVEKAGTRAMARAVAKIQRGSFTNEADESISMTEYISRAMGIFYGGQNTDPTQYIADMQELAERFLALNPDIDVDIPEIQMLLLQAHEEMAREAFTLMAQAKKRDEELGNKESRIKDPATGKIIGYGGEEYARALLATQELMESSSLLKSIKKTATASGRVLRAMQMAEQRDTARTNAAFLKDANATVDGLLTMLKRAKAEVDKARDSGGRAENSLLNLLREKAGGGTGSGEGGYDSGTGRPGSNLTREELLGELFSRGYGAPMRMLEAIGQSITTMAGIRDQLLQGNIADSPYLKKDEMREFLAELEKEANGGIPDPEKVQEFVKKIMGQGTLQYARRIKDREMVPGTNLTHQAYAKREFRARGENYARELISNRIEDLQTWQVRQLQRQIEQGILPNLEEVMKRDVAKRNVALKEGDPTPQVTMLDLYSDLLTKLAEIESWQRNNDPETRVYKQAHGKGLAGALTNRLSDNPQQTMGDLYRAEIDYDTEIEYVSRWVAEAQARDQSVAGNAALTKRLEDRLADLKADHEVALELIADEEATVAADVFGAMVLAFDKSDKARNEYEAKLDQDGLEAAVNLRLGAALYGKINQEAVRDAASGRDIGKVEREVRRVMQEHFHGTYDLKNEVEYWLGFSERIEKEYGQSNDPQVRDRLAFNREVILDAMTNLRSHPQYGDVMTGPLYARYVRAVYGDTGSLVQGIRRALTASDYRVDGRYPNVSDVAALNGDGVLEALAGLSDQAGPLARQPGPLARALADRFDQEAMIQLVDALDQVVLLADKGLGKAFKDAVLAAVDVEHRRAAINEVLPLVEQSPNDLAIRAIAEQQLFDLKELLGDRQSEPWFRRRYGSTEVALRLKYEQAIEKGTERIEREIEQANDAIDTYNALVAAGLETEEDLRRADDGTPFKLSASELIVQRRELLAAKALRAQIINVTNELWNATDAAVRADLEDRQFELLEQLREVGKYTDSETGEERGVGLKMAEKVADSITKRFFAEEEKQGRTQQRAIQNTEIKALTAEIREIHRQILKGYGDDNPQIAAMLQAELQARIEELDAVGATETDPSLQDAGYRAAERLVKELDLKEVRTDQLDQNRKERRQAVEEVRALRNEAMPLVRLLIKDPRDAIAQAQLLDIVGRMQQVGYQEWRDVEVVDRDPTNGGIIGKRTERQLVPVAYGQPHADRLMATAVVRAGSTLDSIRQATTAPMDRAAEKDLIAAIGDRMKMLSVAARESDSLGRVSEEMDEMIKLLEQLGVNGRRAAQREREKLQTTGLSRANLLNDENARQQRVAFFNMIAPGASPSSVSQAIRLMTAPNWVTFYREYGIVAMLSSPTTWGPLGVNNIGQLLNLAVSPARWVTTLGVDVVRGALGQERTIFASEATAALRGLREPGLFWDAAKSAGQIIWNGRSQAQLERANESGDLRDIQPEYMVDWTADRGGAWRILNLLARVGHMSSLRILKASDEFIGTITWAAAYEAQLERKAQQAKLTTLQVKADMTMHADVVRRTGHIQKSVLFQDKDRFLSWINGFVHAAGNLDRDKQTFWTQAIEVMAATYVPFTTVPYNSLKQSAEMSGIGAPILLAAAGTQAWRNRGGAEAAANRVARERNMTRAQLAFIDPDNKMGKMRSLMESEEVVHYLGKAAFGAMVQTLAFMLAANGGLTGDEPEDPDERAVDEAEKLPPRSIKIGDRWYSYDSTPFAVPFAIAGNFFQQFPKEQAKAEKKGIQVGATALAGVAAAWTGSLSAVFHNFFLENVLEVIKGVTNPDQTTTGEKVVYSLLAPVVTRNIPAMLAYYARQQDDFERDTRADDIGNRLLNLGKGRVPILRETLPARMNVLGEKMENKQPFGAGLISYSRSQQAQFDSLFRVLDKYDIKELSPKKELSAPGRQNAQFDITLPEQRIWQETFGKNLRREVAATYNSVDFERIVGVASNQDPKVALEIKQKRQLNEAVSRARAKADEAVIATFGADKFERDLEINRRIAAGRIKRTVTEDDFK